MWRDREFLTFWSAQTVSEFGDRISELALPLIAVTSLNATPAEVGLLVAAAWLPNIVSVLIGSWVDRRSDKRRLMIAADASRTFILLSLPLAFWAGLLSLTQLYVVAFLIGTARVVFNTSYASFFVRLVRPERYLEANGKLSATRSLSSMGGPALAGILIQILSAPVAIIADALSFVFSAVQIGRLQVEPAPIETSDDSVLRRAVEGMRYLVTNPYLRSIVGCATTVNLFSFIGSALLVLFASRNLGLSPGTIGLALGIGASGGLLGAVFASRLTRLIGLGTVVALATIIFPAATAIVAFADGPPLLRATLLGAAEFIGGFAVMCFDVPLAAVQASIIKDNMRSLVSGATLTINFGIRPVGALLGGALGTWLGPRDTLLVSSIGGVLAVLWLFGSPVLRIKTIEQLQAELQSREAADLP